MSNYWQNVGIFCYFFTLVVDKELADIIFIKSLFRVSYEISNITMAWSKLKCNGPEHEQLSTKWEFSKKCLANFCHVCCRFGPEVYRFHETTVQCIICGIKNVRGITTAEMQRSRRGAIFDKMRNYRQNVSRFKYFLSRVF